MPSADFCAAISSSHDSLSPVLGTRRRPPEVSLAAFTAHLPDLQPRALDGYGLRDTVPARPARDASYPVSVRQVAVLLHASFRPRLATTPLRFASASPPSGCAGDLHPRTAKHARHTPKPLRGSPRIERRANLRLFNDLKRPDINRAWQSRSRAACPRTSRNRNRCAVVPGSNDEPTPASSMT